MGTEERPQNMYVTCKLRTIKVFTKTLNKTCNQQTLKKSHEHRKKTLFDGKNDAMVFSTCNTSKNEFTEYILVNSHYAKFSLMKNRKKDYFPTTINQRAT